MAAQKGQYLKTGSGQNAESLSDPDFLRRISDAQIFTQIYWQITAL